VFLRLVVFVISGKVFSSKKEANENFGLPIGLPDLSVSCFLVNVATIAILFLFISFFLSVCYLATFIKNKFDQVSFFTSFLLL
jgi:hypothetical protein